MDPSLGLKRRVFDHYACTEQYQLRPISGSSGFKGLLSSSRESLLKDLREIRNIGNGRSLVFELDDAIARMRIAGPRVLPRRKQPYINIPSGNQWREMYRVKLFKADDSLDRVKRLPYFDFEDTGLIERYGNEIFVSSLDDFSHLGANPLWRNSDDAGIAAGNNP